MDSIKAIGMAVCVTLVVTSIFSMLMPDSKLEKVIKFAISLFFLTSMITPFFTSDIKIEFDINEIISQSKVANLQQTAQNQFVTLAQQNVSATLKRYLENQDIPVVKIEVLINKTDETNISISKLMVYINQNQKDSVARIESLIKREVGVTPSIVLIE